MGLPKTHAIFSFFTNRQTTVNLNPLNTIARVGPIYDYDLITRYMSMNSGLMGVITAVAVALFVFLGFYNWKKRKFVLVWSNFNLLAWLLIGVLGLALYKQTIFDHYLGFLSPAPYIALGSGYWLIRKIQKSSIRFLSLVVMSIGVVILLIINMQALPLQYPPNDELRHTQEIAQFIINQSNNKPFNFALLAEHNYDKAYQYYLDIYNHPPLVVPDHITDQLFVVCEDPVCQPINNPKYEIAAFGWSKIAYEKDFDGVKVFKLIHNYPQSSRSASPK